VEKRDYNTKNLLIELSLGGCPRVNKEGIIVTIPGGRGGGGGLRLSVMKQLIEKSHERVDDPDLVEMMESLRVDQVRGE
jgi:hypothetical protein